MILGIDLGTTFSVLAVQGRVRLAPGYPAQPQYLEACGVSIIPDPYGSYIIPSVLWEDPEQPGRLIAGSLAREAADLGHSPIRFSKRSIGTNLLYPLGGCQLSAGEVARELLSYLKSVAEEALGARLERAVITHPAYFDPAMKEETARAAQDAGFDFDSEKHLLMEPIAAALAYTRADSRDPLRLLTYDLGGGTFDVTVMERRQGVITVKAVGGNRLLGGYNFDRELAHWLLRRLQERGVRVSVDEQDPAGRGRWARLLRLAEEIKIQLARARTGRMPVHIKEQDLFRDDLGRPVNVTESLSRDQFVALIQDFVTETITGSGGAGESKGCEAVLAEAGWTIGQVDEILLVGGSSAGPWIADTIRNLWQREPQLFEPDLCVAVGAALHASTLPEPVGGASCRIELDVPRQSVLESVNVAGRLLPADGGIPRPAGLTVLLSHAGRRLTASPGREGAFLFQEVELPPESVTRFHLAVVDAAGRPIVEHRFEIEQVSGDVPGTTSVLTVLPKPLYIEVLGGMKPLAAEGATLPAHCEVELTRVNDESSIAIRLFQETEALGTVVIEKVPPEAPVGARVKLALDVSRNNRITGRAAVFTRTGQLAAEAPVDIKIPPLQVPELSVLQQEFRGTELERAERIELERSAEARLALQAKGDKLSGRIERMLAAPNPDRQEIWLALRDLRRIVTPPKDDLEPRLDQFERLVLRIREVLGSQGTDPQVQGHAQIVDRQEKEGRAAHAKKDRKAWAQINANLEGLLHRLQRPGSEKSPERDAPPTFLQKLFWRMQLDQTRTLLRAREAELDREGKRERLQVRLNRLRDEIDRVEGEIESVDDQLEPKKAQSRLQLLYYQRVKPVEDAIPTLDDVDVRLA
ncbi:MAG TPA: Hsp70 family protein [Thermoanaerobaculia bacterium]|nr:Hsp70 family protein [Thermoanaerobaculia bacterium]